MPVINIPKVIRDKLGEDGIEERIEGFNLIEKNIREDSMIILEEKFEKRLTEEISRLRVEFKEDIAKLRAEIVETKAFLVKWMFVFWVSQIALILTLFSVFKKI
jgi:hypothetical protein